MFSLEFFPPKTQAGFEKMSKNVDDLSIIAPHYFSITYGAGGSTQQSTAKALQLLMDKQLDVAPHLSCVGSTTEELKNLILSYKERGIKRIVALRGDLPSGMGRYGECRYASDLVTLIRNITGDWFNIEVAAYPEMHPQASSPQEDLKNFITKVKAGANGAITQYFYNIDAYFRFVDELAKHGITIPITAGLMPITNYSQLARFSDACGAEIPRWLRLRLQHFYDDIKSMQDFASDVLASMCEKLIQGGVPGIHFYTLNQAPATLAIYQKLNLQFLPSQPKLLNNFNDKDNSLFPKSLFLPSSGGNVAFT